MMWFAIVVLAVLTTCLWVQASFWKRKVVSWEKQALLENTSKTQAISKYNKIVDDLTHRLGAAEQRVFEIDRTYNNILTAKKCGMEEVICKLQELCK